MQDIRRKMKNSGTVLYCKYSKVPVPSESDAISVEFFITKLTQVGTYRFMYIKVNNKNVPLMKVPSTTVNLLLIPWYRTYGTCRFLASSSRQKCRISGVPYPRSIPYPRTVSYKREEPRSFGVLISWTPPS